MITIYFVDIFLSRSLEREMETYKIRRNYRIIWLKEYLRRAELLQLLHKSKSMLKNIWQVSSFFLGAGAVRCVLDELSMQRGQFDARRGGERDRKKLNIWKEEEKNCVKRNKDEQ